MPATPETHSLLDGLEAGVGAGRGGGERSASTWTFGKRAVLLLGSLVATAGALATPGLGAESPAAAPIGESPGDVDDFLSKLGDLRGAGAHADPTGAPQWALERPWEAQDESKAEYLRHHDPEAQEAQKKRAEAQREQEREQAQRDSQEALTVQKQHQRAVDAGAAALLAVQKQRDAMMQHQVQGDCDDCGWSKNGWGRH